MFIKILTPNHNGKIELTVRDLEALIEEAVEKAVREKCAGCTRGYYGGGITYFNTDKTSNPKLWNPYEITCSDDSINSKVETTNQKDTGLTFMNTLNEMIGGSK